MITRSDDDGQDFGGEVFDGEDFVDPDDPLTVILRPAPGLLGLPPGRYERIRRGAARRRRLRITVGVTLAAAAAALIALPLRPSAPPAPTMPAAPPPPPPTTTSPPPRPPADVSPAPTATPTKQSASPTASPSQWTTPPSSPATAPLDPLPTTPSSLPAR
ncbi:hypothetical protein [Actinacidiphila alni]|uniref:hypothetical protein n=1 Tax=Actinacidiphila alni TaxID=380248 RepID=UPI003453F762